MMGGACIAQVLPAFKLPLDFTLANAVQGMSTAGTVKTTDGQLTYSLDVTPSSVSGRVGYTGSAYFTDPMTEIGNFSCNVN
jgi:hypothetical protein